jgi:ferritin-like protein
MGIAWHAPYELLKPETRDMTRAIHSLMEELEAIDWYGQRADVTDDEALRRTLLHNQEEEKEHAAMVLEWIRRRDPDFDRHLREYLFTVGDILAIEESDKQEAPASRTPPTVASVAPMAAAPASATTVDEFPHTFTVGSLRQKRD